MRFCHQTRVSDPANISKSLSPGFEILMDLVYVQPRDIYVDVGQARADALGIWAPTTCLKYFVVRNYRLRIQHMYLVYSPALI